MGSIVAYKCPACNYATEQLSVGWGKAGRAKFWGGLAVCAECKDLLVLDLAEQRADRRDRRCAKCNAPVKESGREIALRLRRDLALTPLGVGGSCA